MNNLQIRLLNVKSITVGYSFWVKVGQTFLNLFIGSNRVIVCSESCTARVDVYFFVEDSTILFQWYPASLFQYRLVETLTAKYTFIKVTSYQQYVSLHRHNVSVHLNSSLKTPGSLLSCCLCFTQHVWGKKFVTGSAVKLMKQSVDRNLCHSALVSGRIQSFSFFSARARYKKSVSIASSSNLFISQNLSNCSRVPTCIILQNEEWRNKEVKVLCFQFRFLRVQLRTAHCSESRVS